MIDKQLASKIKLIVSDLDGTLLDDKGKISIEVKELVRDLKNEGVTFSIATGRLHSAVLPAAEELSLNGPVISLDGALIKYHSNEKVIFESSLKKRHVKKAIKLSEDYLVNIVLCHAGAIYYTDFNTVIPSLLSKYGAEYKKVESYEEFIGSTLEIVCASDMKDSLKKMNDSFQFPVSVGCSTSFFKSHSYENIFYLEIRKAGSNKGKGLKRLLKHFNLKPETAAVIGDWYNDITLFQTKAYKVAVANAIPELKHLADYVTSGSNNDNGIAEFLKMILKAKKE
jgi:Cof subfamily protein (haloacid dehalogenase superfamily)